MCGKSISDSNENTFCKDCRLRLYNNSKYNDDLIFMGIVEFNKKVNKITNRDIAELTGYSALTIADFMSGKRVTSNVKHSISEALNICEDCT